MHPGGGEFPWFFVLVVGVALVAWFVQRAAHRAHVRQLEAWAAAHGWRYVRGDQELTRRWRGQPFGQGSSRRATDVLSGTYRGRPAVSFTYRWTTGSGKSRTTHTRHVVAVFLPAALPTLELTPEHLGTRIVKALGGQDIQFESEEFNRAWRVTSRDLRFAHDVVHPRTMHRLLEPDARGRSLRVEGDALLTWRSGKTVLADVDPTLHLLESVVGAIPAYVWQDRAGPG